MKRVLTNNSPEQLRCCVGQSRYVLVEEPSFQLETWDFKARCHTLAIWQNKHSNEISSLAAGTNAVVATLSRVDVVSS